MLERNTKCIWRCTPSPPPEEKERLAAERLQRAQGSKPADAAPPANGHANGPAASQQEEAEDEGGVEAVAAVPEDPVLAAITQREVDLFNVSGSRGGSSALLLEGRSNAQQIAGFLLFLESRAFS